ncbi:sialidase family protein [Symmachiella dynata]|uniref:sialidase family protein n=1 Tax=Symmachiella dynata TaxID=2527995 RepID=UPI0030EE078D
MTGEFTRRRMLQTAGILALAMVWGLSNSAFAGPKAVVESTEVISKTPEYYHGWPTLARRADGELLLVYSGGREHHVCPFGRVELMRSHDGGKTWSWPRVVLDGPIDDRDAGVVETADGSILITTFTSLAYEPILNRALAAKPGEAGAMSAEKLARWQAAHERISDAQRKNDIGRWMVRSDDGGVTFSARTNCLVDSPHGPTLLSDGRLLYPGKEVLKPDARVAVAESTDDGKSWKFLSDIPTRPGDDPQNYHELHGVEAVDGTIIVQIRNHNKTNHRETLQCESRDGGKTWTIPHTIGVWGLPSHLLRLKDGRLLMTYGYRRKPYGNQARISSDNGQTWSEPMTISADGLGGDLGYPSTVELDDGTLLTVWYELMKGSPNAVLRQARWSISD